MSTYSSNIWSKISTWLAIILCFVAVTLLRNEKYTGAVICSSASIFFGMYSILRWTSAGRDFWNSLNQPRYGKGIPPMPRAISVVQPQAPQAQQAVAERVASQAVQTPASTSSDVVSKASGFVKGNLYWLVFGALCLLALIFAAFGQFLMAIGIIAMAVGMEINRNNKDGAIMSWMNTTLGPFAAKHWNGIWTTVSAISIVWVLIYGGLLTTLIGWTVSLVAAILTMFSVWGWLGNKINQIMDGKYGWLAMVALIEGMLIVLGLLLLFNGKDEYATLSLGVAMSIPFGIILVAAARKMGTDIFKF